MSMLRFIVLVLVYLLPFVSHAQESKMEQTLGEKQYELIKETQGFYEDQELLEMVARVGNQLKAHLEDTTFNFTYYLIDTTEPNAFATSGGYVYVTRGLLAILKNEDELACILGHEISHVTEHHTRKRLYRNILPMVVEIPGNIIGNLWVEEAGDIINFPVEFFSKSVNSSFDRKQEKKADNKGVELAVRAGFNPITFKEILQRLQKEIDLLTGETAKRSIFNDHPLTTDRVAWLDKKIGQMNSDFREPVSIVQQLDGLVLGQNASGGILTQDNHFYHPGINLFVQMPKGWEVENSPIALTAKSKEDNAVIVIGIDNQHNSIETAAKEYIENVQKDSKLSLSKEDSIPISIYKSREVVTTQKKRKKQIVSLMAWMQLSQSGQILQFAGSTNNEKEFEQIISVIASIRPLENDEKKQIKEHIIRVERGQNETLTEFAVRKSNLDFLPYLEIMNNFEKGQNVVNRELKYVESVPYFH